MKRELGSYRTVARHGIRMWIVFIVFDKFLLCMIKKRYNLI